MGTALIWQADNEQWCCPVTKPSPWTKLTLVERQTCNSAILNCSRTKRDIVRMYPYGSAMFSSSQNSDLALQYQKGVDNIMDLRAMQTVLAWESHPIFCPNRRALLPAHLPVSARAWWCCYHRLPKIQDRYWTSLCTASATCLCFDINNLFSTVLTNMSHANFLPWWFGFFKSLIRSRLTNELFTFYKLTI